MKEKLKKYIFENFTLGLDVKMMVYNILNWIWGQAMDKEDTINALMKLLNGIGIEKEEIK
ncbi:MAG TPA: hypothetical protein DD395_08400 [Lachnospiraceae bacterium]|nr:hypothetical protein [Lachnospiraceae bacterium]